MGLATFASQAHGQGRSRIVNAMHLSRCSTVLAAAFVLTSILTFAAEPILQLMGQPPAVAKTSSNFAVVQLIGLPAMWYGSAIQTVLDGIHRTTPGFYACVVSSVAQVVSGFILMHPRLFNIGYLGMAWSTTISYLAFLLVLIAYVVQQAREPFHRS